MKHTIYLYDDFGKFLSSKEIELSKPHPKNFTLIAPLLVEGTTPVFNFTSWVNVDNNYFKPSLDKLKAEKIKSLRDAFDGRITAIKSDNAAYEPETWTTQNTEWTSYIQNPLNPTPYVDALASARGITREELMVKIGNKVVGIATLQGTQHGIEDQIKAATTEEELNNISW